MFPTLGQLWAFYVGKETVFYIKHDNVGLILAQQTGRFWSTIGMVNLKVAKTLALVAQCWPNRHNHVGQTFTQAKANLG